MNVAEGQLVPCISPLCPSPRRHLRTVGWGWPAIQGMLGTQGLDSISAGLIQQEVDRMPAQKVTLRGYIDALTATCNDQDKVSY